MNTRLLYTVFCALVFVVGVMVASAQWSFTKIIRDLLGPPITIRAGSSVPREQFTECVAVGAVVGTRTDFDCSGVLIAEQLVLTDIAAANACLQTCSLARM